MINEETLPVDAKTMKPGPVEWKPAEQRPPQLDRMLHFHLSPGSLDFAIKAKHIRQFQRDQESRVTMLLITDLMGPQGPIGYKIEEGFDWCMELYTAALENRPINILMHPQTRHQIEGGGIIKS